MKCPECGKEIANDSQFCEFCGAQLNRVKESAGESVMHVRGFLRVSSLLVGLIHVSFFYGMFVENAYDVYPYFDVSTLWIAPVFSLVLLVTGLVLSVRKRLKFIYTILLFLILVTNTAIPIFAENHNYSGVSYEVSVELRENGEYVGRLVGHNYDYNGAQRAEKVFNDILTSSKYKFRDSRASFTDERDYNQAVGRTTDFAALMWSLEALVILVYIAIALIANKREKNEK